MYRCPLCKHHITRLSLSLTHNIADQESFCFFLLISNSIFLKINFSSSFLRHHFSFLFPHSLSSFLLLLFLFSSFFFAVSFITVLCSLFSIPVSFIFSSFSLHVSFLFSSFSLLFSLISWFVFFINFLFRRLLYFFSFSLFSLLVFFFHSILSFPFFFPHSLGQFPASVSHLPHSSSCLFSSFLFFVNSFPSLVSALLLFQFIFYLFETTIHFRTDFQRKSPEHFSRLLRKCGLVS
ncbi:unnamed protein product [Acanthosepion pharaonis]|uniref:Uncharacterized protein n=1 Tax=Acanthosepion pharaonis TaxID=158019 RepID=A0A812EFM6_ACAPH|nr:unnamed protein product [Sepia pharaonis]